ncbi:SDR family oxidoreductase [Hyalangium sp.]|uniref:SDR family oxidoreductase n=1 Tax=Hyalangium sp. TaxID=2028555 RepID=UPI002D2A9C54|nr:SDR family oxidoreductase [Hyalangium sp.]HYH98928.1 SDR family oxidoreductase [Hyalangium sp.]
MKTILVVGATGNIGKEIVAQLARAGGVNVVAASRDVARAKEQFPGVRVIELDPDRPDTLPPALQGVDTVIQVNPMSPVMAQQARSLAQAARQAGVKHLVRSSLMGVGEPDLISEAVWHAEADQAIADSGIPFTLLRPNQYFQNFISARNNQTIRSQGFIALPLGTSRVSNIDTRDIAESAARVALSLGTEHHGKAYVLTGAEASTMEEVAKVMGDAIGKPVRYVAVEPEKFQQGLLGAGLPPVIVDAIQGWFAYCRAGKAERVTKDAEQLLGRKPRTLRQFVQDHVGLWR